MIEGGAPQELDLCLAPGSYTLYGEDGFGDGWNGAVAILSTPYENIGFTVGMASESLQFVLNHPPFEADCLPYNLLVESLSTNIGVAYRFYVIAEAVDDKISAVFGTDELPLIINTPDGIYNDALNSSWNASGVNSAFFAFFPDLEYDSYATIGLDGPASAGEEDPSLVQDASLSPSVSNYFHTGGTGLNVNTLTGASWYVLNTAANALPKDGRWLVAQITTTGSISGTLNYQIFPNGDTSNPIILSTSFSGAGCFGSLPGCTDISACNFDPYSSVDDGSCLFFDECGVCGGEGIPADECDCNRNVIDAVGVCGGGCLQDDDLNGVCDDVEILGCTYELATNFNPAVTRDDGSCVFPCSGELNENVFDWDGDYAVGISDFLMMLSVFGDVDSDSDGIWDSLDNCHDQTACNFADDANEPCTYIPSGQCDCFGNVLDECGECGGEGILLGTCDCDGTPLDAIGVCGGDCIEDVDGDGICDDDDDCVGEFDVCGVCNGPGAIFECGCSNVPDGFCNCDGNTLDECGVCGGTGIPVDDCDCFGNQEDAIGDCGGFCEADEDIDGICDDVDLCVGQFDVCGICNGPGDIYECGCSDIPEGDCDCNGGVLDECGFCNGPGPTEVVIDTIVIVYDSVYLPFDQEWFVYPVDADTSFGFACPPPFMGCGNPIEFQGHAYATVLIGEQCWFAENLRNEKFTSGEIIPSSDSNSTWTSTDSAASAVFGDGPNCSLSSPLENCDPEFYLDEYGRLYNWYAVNDERGLCPQGWHVPSDEEWMTLELTIGMSEDEVTDVGWRGMNEGAQLKAVTGFFDGLPGTNSSGFNGKSGGFRRDNGTYSYGGYQGRWWTYDTDGTSFNRGLSNTHNLIFRNYSAPRTGLSVRCVLD